GLLLVRRRELLCRRGRRRSDGLLRGRRWRWRCELLLWRRGRCGLVDGDAEIGGEPGQSGVVALADGAELPGALAAVELAEHERGLGCRAGAVEAGHLGAARRVEHAHV